MSAWKLETAKARLSEVVRQAKSQGPQTITVRGENSAVVLSSDDYRRLIGSKDATNWVDHFRSGFVGDIDLDREADTGREVDL